MEKIREGFDVFLLEGAKAVGAVREVRSDGVMIYVENAGDFLVPLSAIADAHSEKVILRVEKLEPKLRRALGHIHDAEDPRLG